MGSVSRTKQTVAGLNRKQFFVHSGEELDKRGASPLKLPLSTWPQLGVRSWCF
jgi:hypothetical protein